MLLAVLIATAGIIIGHYNRTQPPHLGEGIHIVEKEGRFYLFIDGVETYIKGIGGSNRLYHASAHGANAFRTWGGSVERVKANLALAEEHNMFLMQGIWLSQDSIDFHDEEYKTRIREFVRTLVEAVHGHPKLLIWGIGNEIDLGTANTPTAWRFVNELALLIRSIDERAILSAVITHNAEALNMIAVYAPAIEMIGINSYGSIGGVQSLVENSLWQGPYMITEWGPTGFWETSLTEWGAPLEETSEEKRLVYEHRYINYIRHAPRCLGSFVFLWGQKQERTPTWFSMFVESNVEGLPLKGEKTPMVEVMERVWTGIEPTQTAPVVRGVYINGRRPIESVRVRRGETFVGKVDAFDREGDTLTYVWEVMKEATILGFGGSFEPRPDRVGEVQTTTQNTVEISIREPGNYRLFVYVLDGTGFVGTANIPFQVQ